MKGKKISILALGCIVAMCAVGCGGGENSLRESGSSSEQDGFPYWETVTERVTARQYYQQEGIEFPASLWETPAAERYEELDKNDVKAYFVSSLEDEQVFCYVGIPQSASKENPVPAVVCVHGATGTAFYDWVEEWVAKGYAAIAMDTEGRMATAETSMYNAVFADSVKPHGPINKAFNDSREPVMRQWVYHALAAVISCTSFIRSFEEVDVERIGITGVSYGGFLTCLAAGYDDRYVFAAPVYGCLSNAGEEADFGTYIDGHPGAEIWDETGALAASNAVFLFVNNNADPFFSLKATARSAAACKQAALCIRSDFSHGHYQGVKVNEIYAFADEICKGGTPLVRITEVTPEDGELVYSLPKGVTIKRAWQYFTLDSALIGSTSWDKTLLEVDGGYAFYSVEAFQDFWYVAIEDDRGFTVACPVVAKNV